ncbi:MAG: oxidoreductase [Oceanospirillaceae bacterium]|uniref:PDR/VanB family oxidoreductase n=1 Tax=Marinobacterium litorale TaxID=404770 RepID=UPI0004113352|nr:PDR/VanB family oxidoreductase [Marinobacterium litorale]MBS98254.1 oxidoreductase [Oceanospirillaceae bacterium]
MKLEVTARRALTPEIEEFTLSSLDGEVLPPAEPGAHVSITTPSGAHRYYSLVHPGDSPRSYTVAIKREPNSRGGSESMHEQAIVGSVLDVEPPDNEFPLGVGHAALLIGGGIGITPIYSMAQRLQEEGRQYRVVYCARDPEHAAYAEELRQLCGDALTFHCNYGDRSSAFDFWDLLMTPTAEHIYCCGPSSLMEEVKGVTGHWPDGRVHFEEFMPVEIIRADDKAFEVVLAKSGASITVPADHTILEALRANGYEFSSSCETGTCGTCKCRYIEGEVDHRDLALMPEEKSSTIMLCVSRAKGDQLVLDI